MNLFPSPLNIFVDLILGLVAGLIVNYFCDVLPYTRTFSRPFCLKFQHPFHWIDYILFRQCSECQSRRTFRAVFVQILYPILVIITDYYPLHRLGFWLGLLLLVYFGVVFVMDVEYRVVLQQVSIVGVVIAVLLGLYVHNILTVILGGAAGFGIMFGLYWLGQLFSKWMAHVRKQEIEEVALGFGDVYLSGILGLILGWPGITLGLFMAIVFGGVFSGLMLLVSILRRKYQAFTAIPYAPFLIMALIFLHYWP
jgi:prepilin signal peptidase PulO-like enzyme (type II secretory pathway)